MQKYKQAMYMPEAEFPDTPPILLSLMLNSDNNNSYIYVLNL